METLGLFIFPKLETSRASFLPPSLCVCDTRMYWTLIASPNMPANSSEKMFKTQWDLLAPFLSKKQKQGIFHGQAGRTHCEAGCDDWRRGTDLS